MLLGLDSADIVSKLRAAHAHDDDTLMGVDVLTGSIGDMAANGICESFKVGVVPLILWPCKNVFLSLIDSMAGL